MGPTGCPETSVRNCHYWLRNKPEERSSELLRGGSLKSHTVPMDFLELWQCETTANLLQNGRNALHLASSAGHADVVAALILAGCDVNVSDSVSTFISTHLHDEGTEQS